MRLALLTPTYGPDLARFQLSRASILASGCTLEHVAVVQSEDYAAFAAAGLDDLVRLIPSSEVLPAEVEAGRRRFLRYPRPLQKLMRSLHKRFGIFPMAAMMGWNVQQLVKLSAPILLGYDAMISMDSDLLVCGRDPFPSFAREEAVALNYFGDQSYWHPHWEQAASDLLGLPPRPAAEAGAVLRNYVVHPFVFARASLLALHQHIEQQSGLGWWQALLGLKLGTFSEFTIYGHFVERVQAMQNHFAQDLKSRTRWIYTEEDHRNAAQNISAAFADAASDFLVIQSSRHHPVEAYERLIRAQLALLRPAQA